MHREIATEWGTLSILSGPKRIVKHPLPGVVPSLKMDFFCIGTTEPRGQHRSIFTLARSTETGHWETSREGGGMTRRSFTDRPICGIIQESKTSPARRAFPANIAVEAGFFPPFPPVESVSIR